MVTQSSSSGFIWRISWTEESGEYFPSFILPFSLNIRYSNVRKHTYLQLSYPRNDLTPRVLLLLLLLLLSHFSRVQLCATPQTAAHQAPRPIIMTLQLLLSLLNFHYCWNIQENFTFSPMNVLLTLRINRFLSQMYHIVILLMQNKFQ